MLKKGDKAPDFTLVDEEGNDVKLADLKGKRVLLSFHPLAFTGVCTDQMRDLEKNMDKLKDKGFDKVYGVSVDAYPTKSAWSKALALDELSILSDFEPKAEVAKAYGIYNEEMGTSGRANVVIDKDGKIEVVKVYDVPELPDLDAFLSEL